MFSHFKHFILLLLALLIGVSSFAKAPRPLSELCSYEQFESLLKYNAGRVPELVPLWRIAQSSKQRMDWTGGTVLGLLHWHYNQLQNHTADEIRQMPPPHISDLQLSGGYDVDLIGPVALQKTVSQALTGIAEVDFISTATAAQLVEVGGPTIEKIKINPTSLTDPYGAVKKYYQGFLEFKWIAEVDFRNHKAFLEGDYTKTNEALRFIRFLHVLPELTADPKSIGAIRTIAELEIPFLLREDRIDFLYITIEKLVVAYENNLQELALQLMKYNLLPILVKLNIYYPSQLDLATYLKSYALDTRNMSLQDLRNLQRVFSKPSAAALVRFLDLMSSRIKSTQDFLVLTIDPAPEMRNATNKWVKKNLRLFLSLHPTTLQFEQLSQNYPEILKTKNLDTLKISNGVFRCIDLFN